MVTVGTIVKTHDGKQEFIVAEVGAPYAMSGGYVAPVKLGNGKYAIVNGYDAGYPYAHRFWVPDTEKAAAALSGSVEMPTVQHGIGSEVLHVRGRDAAGTYLIKLFYNDKKIYHQRSDEIWR